MCEWSDSGVTCPEHNKATAKMVEAALVPKIGESRE